MRPLFTLIPLLLALCAGCVPSTAETELLARIEGLRAADKLPADGDEAPPEVEPTGI